MQREHLVRLCKNINLTVQSYSSAEQLLNESTLSKPSLLITDVLLPGVSGIDLAIKLKSIYPKLKVLILTAEIDPNTIQKCRENNLNDLIDRTSCDDEQLKDIILHSISRKKNRSLATSALSNTPDIPLTKSELSVIPFFVKGMSDYEIATHLNKTERSILRHRENIMNKFKLKSAQDLIKLAIEKGIWKYRANVELEQK